MSSHDALTDSAGLFRQTSDELAPAFHFTSTTINRDVQAAIHVGSGNRGSSLVFVVGRRAGSGLWVEAGGCPRGVGATCASITLSLPAPLASRLGLISPAYAQGSAMDARQGVVVPNGVLHCVLPDPGQDLAP